MGGNKDVNILAEDGYYKPLELLLRVFLAGYTVTMVTYCVTKFITTCSLMIGQFFDTMIVASRLAIMTHKNITAGNCLEPPKVPAAG